jgi:ethanolamine utilization protein EutN
MQLARVVGRATATVKHRTLAGRTLLLVQPLDAAGDPDGEPQLAIDSMGSGQKDIVLLTSDSSAVRDLVKADDSPIRWAIIGIPDA